MKLPKLEREIEAATADVTLQNELRRRQAVELEQASASSRSFSRTVLTSSEHC